MARCMLLAKGMSLKLWAEAVNCANYVLNRLPTKALYGVTPEEKWTGFKPSVAHFKIFGCIAWVHIPDKKRQKLDPKSQKCIFVGYSDCSKAYRIYDPISGHVDDKRDVKFDEYHSFYSTSQFEDIPLIKEEPDISLEDSHAFPPLSSHGPTLTSTFVPSKASTSLTGPSSPCYSPTSVDDSSHIIDHGGDEQVHDVGTSKVVPKKLLWMKKTCEAIKVHIQSLVVLNKLMLVARINL